MAVKLMLLSLFKISWYQINLEDAVIIVVLKKLNKWSSDLSGL